MKDLVIYGTGGYGRMAVEVAEAMNDDGAGWNILGFLDDDPETHGGEVYGYSVLGDGSWLRGREQVRVTVCTGVAAIRHRVVEWLRAHGHGQFATLVHPGAHRARRMQMGAGCVVSPGAVVDTGAVIGNHVQINRNASVGHDSRVDDWVNLSPAVTLAGDCHIEQGCEIGAGAAVIPGRCIGPWSVVGAGAVVTGDLGANVTAVGVPAHVIKRRDPGWHRPSDDTP